MGAIHSLFTIAFAIIFLPFLSLTQDDDHHHGIGFSLELIHRDSPSSPLYNPAESHWQRLSNALQRSHHRVTNHFGRKGSGLRATSPTGEAHLFYVAGEYLVNISIGTPPKTLIGIVDTGSDLTWTQCKPCKDCFKQKIPIFDPNSSSTYEPLSCLSKQCHLLSEGTCSNDKFCYYNYTYGDNSYTSGNLSVDTLTLASRTAGKAAVSIPNTIFGCGHHNGGIFSGTETGIVGLGSGAVSLISQIRNVVGRKSFSYCLVPSYELQFHSNLHSKQSSQSEIPSKMYFGGKVSGRDVVSTPFLSNGSQTYYYIELQGMSVGDDYLKLEVSGRQSFKGNMIIDSGTTITALPTKLYESFESAIRRAIHLEVTKDPTGILQLCYKTKPEIDAPIVTVHFRGADVKLKSVSTFVRVREDVVCLAFSPTDDVGIFGNVAQMNFLVGFDLQERTLSFKATDCSTR